jgi:CRP-like cAMP-binding protein
MPRSDALLQTLAANVHLLRGMTRTQLVALLAVAERCAVHGGHYFFKEGDAGTSFYVLVGGTASVYTEREGRRVKLASLRGGDCFGEMCLVGARTRSATVRAMEDSLALRFAKDKVDAQHELAAVMYRNIASVLMRRLVQSNDKVGELLLRHDDGVTENHIYGIKPTRALGGTDPP